MKIVAKGSIESILLRKCWAFIACLYNLSLSIRWSSDGIR